MILTYILAKNFNRSLASFALVPDADPFPLTSNVMVVNKDGDLELYAVHDTPTHTTWSPRGDLSLGIGRSYKIVPGFHDSGPPPEPWEILMEPTPPPTSTPLPADESHPKEQHNQSRAPSPPPTFGRGDEDGFPALLPSVPHLNLKTQANLSATRPAASRIYDSAALRDTQFEHTIPTPIKHSHSSGSDHHSALRVGNSHGKHKTGHRHSREPSPGWGQSTHATLQHSIEEDISMVMRHRVIRGYGLTNVRKIYLFSSRTLWLTRRCHSRRIMQPSLARLLPMT